MPYSNTPGKHLNYWSGTVATSAITIFTVPAGYTFYLDYLVMATFTPIPNTAVIYVGADGVPILLVSPEAQSDGISFVKPIICASQMIIGPFGNLGGQIISAVVAWSGEVR